MDFKKRFDYKDMNNFLPDNYVMGTSYYYKEKYKLPEYEYMILEAKSRIEYSDEDVNKVLEKVKDIKLSEYDSMMNELISRGYLNGESNNTPGDKTEGNEKQHSISNNELISNISK